MSVPDITGLVKAICAGDVVLALIVIILAWREYLQTHRRY